MRIIYHHYDSPTIGINRDLMWKPNTEVCAIFMVLITSEGFAMTSTFYGILTLTDGYSEGKIINKCFVHNATFKLNLISRTESMRRTTDIENELSI